MFVLSLLGCWLTLNSNIGIVAMAVNKIAFTTQAVYLEPIVRPMIQETIKSHKLQDGSDWFDYCISFSSERSFATDTLTIKNAAIASEESRGDGNECVQANDEDVKMLTLSHTTPNISGKKVTTQRTESATQKTQKNIQKWARGKAEDKYNATSATNTDKTSHKQAPFTSPICYLNRQPNLCPSERYRPQWSSNVNSNISPHKLIVH